MILSQVPYQKAFGIVPEIIIYHDPYATFKSTPRFFIIKTFKVDVDDSEYAPLPILGNELSKNKKHRYLFIWLRNIEY